MSHVTPAPLHFNLSGYHFQRAGFSAILAAQSGDYAALEVQGVKYEFNRLRRSKGVDAEGYAKDNAVRYLYESPDAFGGRALVVNCGVELPFLGVLEFVSMGRIAVRALFAIDHETQTRVDNWIDLLPVNSAPFFMSDAAVWEYIKSRALPAAA